MSVQKAIARAWADAEYKAKLIRDPRAALAEVGVTFPAGTTVKVVQDTGDIRHVVIPVPQADADKLSDEELDGIAGGNQRVGIPSPA